MTTTIATVCPTFCTSPHDEQPDEIRVHVSEYTFTPSNGVPIRINVEQYDEEREPYIYLSGPKDPELRPADLRGLIAKLNEALAAAVAR